MERQRSVHEQWDLRDIDIDELMEGIGEGDSGWSDTPVSHLTPHELGALGETLAAVFLVHNGYELIEHSYRCPEGEADYVAYDPVDESIVLVEVKTRRVRSLAEDSFPEEAVDERKQARYRRIASSYLMDNYPVPALRFDVVGIMLTGGDRVDIEQTCGAFDWECDR